MKIAVISDLHGKLPNYDLDGVELLLICGDISPLCIQSDMRAMQRWLCDDFNEWCLERNVNKTIFIGGNHDFICERKDKWVHKEFSKRFDITYLKNESLDYISEQDSKVYKIFGTPYCKQFGNWAFMREAEILKEKFSLIPDNLDILISHDAPKIGKLGTFSDKNSEWYGEDAGNYELANAIKEHKPKYAFCGHIHSGSHILQNIDGTTIANTSIVDEKYFVVNPPLLLEI